MSHLFISYSKKDIAFARRLKEALQDANFSIWMDEQALEPSDKWWDVIEQNIIVSKAVIVIVSANSRKSRWVERELLVAENHNKSIFPVLIEGEAWSRLGDVQHEDMRGRQRISLSSQLLRGLQKAFDGSSEATPAIEPKSRLSRVDPAIIAAFIGGIFLIIAAIISGIFLLISAGGNDNNGTEKNTATKAIVEISSETPTLTDTATIEPEPSTTQTETATSTVSYTPSLTASAAVNPSATLTPTSSVTNTATETTTPTATATSTSTNTPTTTPTNTLLPTVISTPSRTPTAQISPSSPSNTTANSYPCDGTIVGNGTSPLFVIYSRPISRQSPIASISSNTEISVLSTTNESGRKWYEISYENGQKSGWVWDSYVLPSEYCP